jgi:hypothetical protein
MEGDDGGLLKPGAEYVVGDWEARFNRLKTSSARQLAELAADNERLRADVARLRSMLVAVGLDPDDRAGFGDEGDGDDDGGFSMPSSLGGGGDGGVVGGAGGGEGGVSSRDVVVVLPRDPSMSLRESPLAVGSAVHGHANVVAVCVLGRAVTLPESPVVVMSGGADRRVVLSLMLGVSGGARRL